MASTRDELYDRLRSTPASILLSNMDYINSAHRKNDLDLLRLFETVFASPEGEHHIDIPAGTVERIARLLRTNGRSTDVPLLSRESCVAYYLVDESLDMHVYRLNTANHEAEQMVWSDPEQAGALYLMVLDRPELGERVCEIITERGITHAKTVEEVLTRMDAVPALGDGIL